jgi:hypothetical protein
MSIAVKCAHCGRELQVEQFANEEPRLCPECSSPRRAAENRISATLHPSGSDLLKVAQPELPRLQTFEELGLGEKFRQALEGELTKDEKLVWLGRPSRNPAIYPQLTLKLLPVIGGALVVLALVLALVKAPLFFAGAIGLFGLLFFGFFQLVRSGKFNPANSYQACYAVTNRRAMLFEMGFMGLETQPGTLPNFMGVRCKSYLAHQLLGLEARKHPTEPGAGDLIFDYIFVIGRNVTNFPGTTGTVQRTDAPQQVGRGFFYLDQVREVEQVIRQTLLPNQETKTETPLAFSPSAAAGIATPQIPVVCREDSPIPPALKEKVLADLAANEQVVWLGQPAVDLVFRRSLGYLAVGAIMALISLVWLLSGLFPKQVAKVPVAVKGVAAQAKPPAQHSSPLPVIFLLTSVGIMLVPLARWKIAKGTCYALTNRRALVYKEGLLSPTRESYSPLEVAHLRRLDSWIFRNGGDVVFRSVTVVSQSRNSRGQSQASVQTIHYGFLALKQVKEVEKLVRETLVDRFVDKLQAANSF